MTTPVLIRALTASLLIAGVSSQAVADESHCESGVGERRAATPTSEFELPRDGTVIHSRTGLQWAQCALGQAWEREACNGQATSLSWSEAVDAVAELNRSSRLAGFNDWRLPSRQELESIVENCREAPAINENVFPNTPWAGFWTVSTDTTEENHAWFVGFYYGLTLEYSQDSSYRVRPVRTR